MEKTIKNIYSNLNWINFDSSWLYEGENRFDGSFYCDSDIKTRISFENSSFQKVTLKEFLNLDNNWEDVIFLPNRSSRVYVEKEYGIPYFSGSDILNSYPKASSYIAKNHKAVKNTLIKKGWLLVAARGTVGNTVIASKRMNKTCASDNIIRVCTNENHPAGFIYAFFKSKYGVFQFRKNVYGAVVDAISPNHIASIRLPLLKKKDIDFINKSILEAYFLREKANDLIEESGELFFKLLKLPKNLGNKDYIEGENKFYEIEAFGFEKRIDASFYNPKVDEVVKKLKKSGLKVVQLKDKEFIKKVFIPGRFKRVYVEKEYGIPFLSGKNITQTEPQELKFISPSKTKKLSTYVINKNWILITCSGTIGKVSMVPSSWEGWTATQHVLRIVPNKIHPGYLFSFISSFYGLYQIQKYIHGSVVDEITAPQAEQIYMPIPSVKIQEEIGQKVEESYSLIDKANNIEKNAISFLNKQIEESSTN